MRRLLAGGAGLEMLLVVAACGGGGSGGDSAAVSVPDDSGPGAVAVADTAVASGEIDLDAPAIVSAVLTGESGAQQVFDPFETVRVAVDLTKLTDEILISIDAETVPVGGGVGRLVRADSLLERGDDYEGGEHTEVERLAAPLEGWAEGQHVATIDVEVADRTGAHEPVSARFELEFTVEIPEVTTETYGLAGGRLAFRHPSDWRVTESSPPTRITTNRDVGPPVFEARSATLSPVVSMTPRPANASIDVFVESARFTAPGLLDWTDLRLANLAAQGFEPTERRDVDLAHGPGIVVSGTLPDQVSVLLFTQSADRLYAVEFRADEPVDEAVAAAADLVLDSLRFDPAAEPLATPLEEARTVPITITSSAGDAIVEASIDLPADWTVDDTVEQVAPGRFVMRAVGPDRGDGSPPVDGYFSLELLDPPPALSDYADFYIDRAAVQYAPVGYTLIERSSMRISDVGATAVTWSAAGEVFDEVFAVVDGIGVTLRFEFAAGDLVAELLDAVAGTVDVESPSG